MLLLEVFPIPLPPPPPLLPTLIMMLLVPIITPTNEWSKVFLSKETKELRVWPRTNRFQVICALTPYIDVSTFNKVEKLREKAIDLLARNASLNITAEENLGTRWLVVAEVRASKQRMLESRGETVTLNIVKCRLNLLIT